MKTVTRKRFLRAAVGAGALNAVSFGQAPAGRRGTQSSPMDSVLLKDYEPEVSLVVPETPLTKAKFPAIDVHSHTYARTPEEISGWVRMMDQAGVELTVILTGATGARFDQAVELFLKPHPGRFQLYCGIDTSNFEANDFPQRAAAELERCFRKGARGVGEVIDKGSGLSRGSGLLPRDKRLHPDNPRLDLFWQKCAELKIPTNLHMADHPSCWRPPDNKQERPPRFQNFNQFGRDVPSYEELLEIRDRTLARHPKTLFVCCHLGNQGNDLASLSKLLDKYPNLYVDISARAYEVGRQPRYAAKFLRKYQDRVVFGTDQSINQKMYSAWWRLFETEDDFMPGPSWWRHYGLALPDPVLKKLYRDVAKKIMNWEKV